MHLIQISLKFVPTCGTNRRYVSTWTLIGLMTWHIYVKYESLIREFCFKKIRLKMSFAQCRPFFRADGGVGPRVSVRIASCPRYFHRGCGDLWCRRSLDVLGSNSRTTPPPGERYLGMSPWLVYTGGTTNQTGTRRNKNVIMMSKRRRRFDIMMTLLSRRVSAAKLLPGFKHCNPFEDRMPIRG